MWPKVSTWYESLGLRLRFGLNFLWAARALSPHELKRKRKCVVAAMTSEDLITMEAPFGFLFSFQRSKMVES